MENLIGNTKEIPVNIKKILNRFIRENTYYPKKYLSIFQLKRLDFNLYGGTRNMNNEKGGLILSFLLICGITVQQILLHLHEIINGFNNYNNVISNCKYIGTLLHYLTKETFSDDYQIPNDTFSLLNYCRNYHLYENKIENSSSLFPIVNLNDENDQFNQFLYSNDIILPFFNNNPYFVILNGLFFDYTAQYFIHGDGTGELSCRSRPPFFHRFFNPDADFYRLKIP